MHSFFTHVHVKISSSTKDLHDISPLFFCAALTHLQQQISEGSHANTLLFKGLLLYNNTHKRNMFHYNITVPPGGQRVLFPQCHRMFFPSISIYQLFLSVIVWRFPQKAIYLFLQWLRDVLFRKAVKKKNQCNMYRQERGRRWRKKECAVFAFRLLCQCALSQRKSIKVVFC